MAISVLNEIKDLPAKVTDPNWLDEADDAQIRRMFEKRGLMQYVAKAIIFDRDKYE